MAKTHSMLRLHRVYVEERAFGAIFRSASGCVCMYVLWFPRDLDGSCFFNQYLFLLVVVFSELTYSTVSPGVGDYKAGQSLCFISIFIFSAYLLWQKLTRCLVCQELFM